MTRNCRYLRVLPRSVDQLSEFTKKESRISVFSMCGSCCNKIISDSGMGACFDIVDWWSLSVFFSFRFLRNPIPYQILFNQTCLNLSRSNPNFSRQLWGIRTMRLCTILSYQPCACAVEFTQAFEPVERFRRRHSRRPENFSSVFEFE